MADDVEARVRVAEEELNLLKNQVQQTLLDVREHVLDLVESGAGIPSVDRPVESETATETTTEMSPPPPLPATQIGSAPLPNLGGDAGLGAMPGLDMGGDAGMGAMPGLDMGGDAGMGDMPGLDMGGDAGPADMPVMEMGEDPGLADMGDLDAGTGMDAGFDDMPGVDEMGGGFDMENAPYDGAEQTPAGPGIADGPSYDADAPEAYAGEAPRRSARGPRPEGNGGDYDDAGPAALPEAPAGVPEGAIQPPVESPAEAPPPVSGLPAPVGVDSALAEMDLVTLVGVVRWVDQAVQRLGQRRVDALLDVWQMTGRISGPTKEMIQRLCALTNEDPEERVPLRDLVAMMIQMEAVLDAEESSNSRLLAMLFEDPGDPLAGLGSLARR